MKKMIIAGVSLIAVSTLAACGNDEGEGTTENSTEINIGYNTYAEAIAFAHVWEQLLEEKGYEVEAAAVEKAFLFEGTENGDFDIAFNTWLPFTDQAYLTKDSETIDVQEDGVIYEGATLGLAVPTYMEDIHSIEDLKSYYDELNGTIVGIDPGSALMQITEDEIIPHYGLEDFTLSSSSEQAMIQQLETAYQNEEPIVVTLWNPHWSFNDYDMKYLEDPDNVYGDPDDIYYIARNGLAEDIPEIVDWLNNSYFDDDSLSELLALQNELDDVEAAKEWIENNRELVDNWMK
ncbi:glycine betaine ABC transporter substrate-binding protein [Shouchella patagoniensis]|uniref:glycine betaine ABC transporter substrate-binding protein n=1 Tax=Shouchella patagoniensis TaxID=228576 RepID=UPI000994B79F|nr:glycine betaine ABC transporter substrate-binding protein [Shouchella patagoniensis]